MYSYLKKSKKKSKKKKKKKKKVNYFKKPKNNKINYCKYVKKKNVMLFIEWIQALERFVSGFIELTVHSPVLLRVSLCLGKRTCSVVVALPSVSPPSALAVLFFLWSDECRCAPPPTRPPPHNVRHRPAVHRNPDHPHARHRGHHRNRGASNGRHIPRLLSIE